MGSHFHHWARSGLNAFWIWFVRVEHLVNQVSRVHVRRAFQVIPSAAALLRVLFPSTVAGMMAVVPPSAVQMLN